MVRLTTALLAAAALTQAVPAWAADHAAVAAAAKPAGGGIAFEFKVNPAHGLHINMEGPWKLELTDTAGLAFAKTTLTKGEMDEKLPGFTIKTAGLPQAKSGDVGYKLTAFVCTDDKTQCFRDVLSGKVGWTTAAK